MTKFFRFHLFWFTVTLILLSGCSSPTTNIQIPTATEELLLLQPTLTPSPTHTITPSPTPTATNTPVPISAICSPLQDIQLDDLKKITSQGFSSPAPYTDDGHPAVDLAFFTFKDMPSMVGHPVQSILPGVVSLVIEDRYPYGNAILIETPLHLVSSDLLDTMVLPTLIPQQNLDQVQPCDSDPVFKGMKSIEWSENSRSLYVLYAHLLEKPGLTRGESVDCGAVIGAVGNTGNSAAEHLHLETRIGPANAQFTKLAMYSPEATKEERYSYCIWTSSGRFQAFNPIRLWEPEQ